MSSSTTDRRPLASTAPGSGPVRDARVPATLRNAAAWSWRLLVVAAAMAAVLWVLSELRLVVLPVVGALFLSTVLAPLAARLRRRGWPRLLATWAVFGGFLLVVAATLAFVGTQIAGQFSALGDDLQRALDDVEQWARRDPLNLSPAEIDRYRDQAGEVLTGDGGALSSRIPTGARLAVETVAGALLGLTITFFFVKDGDRIGTSLFRLVPRHRRVQVETAAAAAGDALGAYLRGVAITGAVEAVVIGIALLAIGVPLVVPLMILTFLAAFLPLVGAVTAGAIACIVALVSGGIVDALLVGGVVIVVQQLEGDLLAPLVLGRSVRLHPLVILLSLATGTIVGGIVGAFLAVPIAAVTVAIVRALGATDPPEREWSTRCLGPRPPRTDDRNPGGTMHQPTAQHTLHRVRLDLPPTPRTTTSDRAVVDAVQTLLARKVRALAPLGRGSDHIVYDVDGTLVVRVRRDGHATEHTIDHEIRVLEVAARASPVPVPEVVAVDRDAGMLVLRKLPGTPLLGAMPTNRGPLVDQLAAFLTSLWDVRDSELTGVERDDSCLASDVSDAARALPAIAPVLSIEQRRLVEELIATPPPREPARLRFCHNDLGAEHLLATADRSSLTGIIDWSDAAIADPARDVGRLVRDLGPVTAMRIVATLGTVDERLFERATFHACCALVEDLHYGIRTCEHRYRDAALASFDRTFTAWRALNA